MKFKEALLNTGVFKSVSSKGQYKCQYCPFCGDGKYHMYVKIDCDSDIPVLYNCKKCNASGIINDQFLEYYGIDLKIPKGNFGKHRNYRSLRNELGTVEKKPFVDERNNVSDVCEYICKRLGIDEVNLKDLQMFQYVGNPMMYATEYLGYNGKPGYFKNRCWFKLTNGGLIGRDMRGDDGLRWLFCKSDKLIGKGLYQIRNQIDTGKSIHICISEGIMDSIGLYYHGRINNGVFISCMGSDYVRGIKHAVDLGLFGDSCDVGIYVDNDVDVNRLYVDRHLCQLFKHVNIYHNTESKDYGVSVNMMNIERVRRIK